MRATKHGTTNYKMLLPYLKALDEKTCDDGTSWLRFTAAGYMDLSMESLGYTDYRGLPVYYMAHYGEQNGDLMADPCIEFSVDREKGVIHPLNYRNDYMGLYQEVYRTRNGQRLYSPSLRTSLDDFLWHWLKNIEDQGFTPENRKEAA